MTDLVCIRTLQVSPPLHESPSLQPLIKSRTLADSTQYLASAMTSPTESLQTLSRIFSMNTALLKRLPKSWLFYRPFY